MYEDGIWLCLQALILYEILKVPELKDQVLLEYGLIFCTAQSVMSFFMNLLYVLLRSNALDEEKLLCMMNMMTANC